MRRFYTWSEIGHGLNELISARFDGTNVKVKIEPGDINVSPTPGAVLLVTAYNDSNEAVRVTSVAVEMNDDAKGKIAQFWLNHPRRLAVRPKLVEGATMPGKIGPHDSGMTWFGPELTKDGFDPRRPVRAYVMLANRERPVWSKRRKLGH
jgi:hypothetical protein